MEKVFKVADIRDLEQKVALGEMSYSRMVEVLNEKAEEHYSKVKKLNEPAVSGSCFWGHKWTKWEQYNASMLLIADMKTEYKQLRQRRTCLRCGKMELEDL